MGGVERDWEEEETCPRASPLTLIGIEKGPKNRGKEKVVEAEEKEGDDKENLQVQFESAAQEHQDKQRSLSHILIESPDVRDIHQETTKS